MINFTQGVAALHYCTKQFQELICEFAKCFEILQDEECHKMEVIIPLAKKLFIFFLCKALEFLQTFLRQKLIRARCGSYNILALPLRQRTNQVQSYVN